MDNDAANLTKRKPKHPGADTSGAVGTAADGGGAGAGAGAVAGAGASADADLRPTTPARSPPPTRRKLHIAPINTPMKHRLQTLGLIWHTILIPFFMFVFLFTLYLGWVAWVMVILPYFIWWYGFDLHTPANGKTQYRYKDWARNLIVWEWFVDYFPIRVHKACELEPTFLHVLVEETLAQPDDEEDLVLENSRTLLDTVFKRLGLQKRINVIDAYLPPASGGRKKHKKVLTGPRYIFGYHPHGVISMGVMGTFGTNAIRNEPFEPPLKFLKPLFHDPTGKERLLPDIEKIFPSTLSTQFTLPFYRDYLLSLGLTSAAAKNIKSLIQNGDNSIVLVVGGAQESLLNDVVASHAQVGNGYTGPRQKEEPPHLKQQLQDTSGPPQSREIRLVLNKRKGFVKIAIELGNISLVPIFAFGEADIYNVNIPDKGTWGEHFQLWMKKVFSFTLPFFSARGVFIYDFGFLPYRHPINLCMGRPIHIPAGTLQEYKMKHPDWDESADKPAPTHLDAAKRTSSRSNSFSNLFKLNQKSAAPKPKPSKTIVPPKLLDHYHRLYMDELKRVYEENKDKFGYSDVKLNIVE